jgi:hypothetical protein
VGELDAAEWLIPQEKATLQDLPYSTETLNLL